jgi:peptide/nickel transport system substrate-binding protein
MVRVRAAALLTILALLFLACQPAGQTTAPTTGASPTDGASPTEAASPTDGAGEPVQGGTLIVAIPGDITRTDPALIDDSNSSYVMNNVLEGLVGLAPGSTSELVPALATEWSLSDDGLTYTFTLREGVKFHDGTDFDAEAVKVNYERWKNFPEELQAYSYYAGAVFGGYGEESNVESVTVNSPTEVEIVLRRPNTSFLLSQTLAPFFISSPAALEEGDADNLDVSNSKYAQGGPPAMVGTGPFKFEEWVVGDHVTIVRSEDYWDPEKAAYLDEVIFRPYADQTAELNALQAGEVDLAQTIFPNDVETVEGDDTLQVIDRGESCNTAHLALNHKFQPVDNKDIRFAIAHALDRQAYIDAFYAGQAVVAENWMPPGTAEWKALDIPEYDPDAARALIESSGVTDLSIDFTYPSDVARPYMPDPKGLFEAISRDLEAVGFTVTAHTETWSPDYLDHEFAGNFEMWLIGWTCDWAGPDNFLRTAFCFAYIDGAPSTECDYDNAELDETMLQALEATDPAEASQLWSDAQDMLAADLPTVPLLHSTPPGAASARVQGFVGAGNLNELLNSVWLSEE